MSLFSLVLVQKPFLVHINIVISTKSFKQSCNYVLEFVLEKYLRKYLNEKLSCFQLSLMVNVNILLYCSNFCKKCLNFMCEYIFFFKCSFFVQKPKCFPKNTSYCHSFFYIHSHSIHGTVM